MGGCGGISERNEQKSNKHASVWEVSTNWMFFQRFAWSSCVCCMYSFDICFVDPITSDFLWLPEYKGKFFIYAKLIGTYIRVQEAINIWGCTIILCLNEIQTKVLWNRVVSFFLVLLVIKTMSDLVRKLENCLTGWCRHLTLKKL